MMCFLFCVKNPKHSTVNCYIAKNKKIFTAFPVPLFPVLLFPVPLFPFPPFPVPPALQCNPARSARWIALIKSREVLMYRMKHKQSINSFKNYK